MPDTSQELAFGSFLKFWRGIHSISQESLADRLGSSPRHISRLENGFSRPSENIIEDIAQALELGERDRNHLRIAAGYSAKQRKIDYHSDELKWLRKAMKLTLRALDPYPSALIDSVSNILMVNRAWVNFYRPYIDKTSFDEIHNHIDFMFSRQGAGALMENREDTLSALLMTHSQAAMLSRTVEDRAAVDRLLKNPNLPADWQQRAAKLEPMASFKVEVDYQGRLEKFYSVNQNIGASGSTAYISEPRLTISTLYPEDDELDLSGLAAPVTHPLVFY